VAHVFENSGIHLLLLPTLQVPLTDSELCTRSTQHIAGVCPGILHKSSALKQASIFDPATSQIILAWDGDKIGKIPLPAPQTICSSQSVIENLFAESGI
jgi:hypothetical protein